MTMSQSARSCMLGSAFEPGTNGLRRFLDRAFLGKFRQRLFDPGKPLVEILLVDFEHGYIESGCGRDLRDPGTHEATPENGDTLDFHS